MTSPLSAIDTNSRKHYDHDNIPRSQKPFVTTLCVRPTMSFNDSSLYFPIQTLAQNLEVVDGDWITTHDLVESYTTLYIRLRALAFCEEDPAITNCLRRNIPTLVQCARRHIAEGLSFFPRPSMPMSASEMSYTPTLEEYEIQASVDSSALCHSALLLVSLLLSLPLISSLLSESERSLLLDPIIEICGERHLSVFNADKICSQAFFCLRAPTVSQSILPPRLRTVTDSLESALARDDDDQVKGHAFKTLHSFLFQSPLRFVQPFSTLLPKVLVNVGSASTLSRVEGTHALCGFVVAKWAVLDTMPDLVVSISNEVHDFLDHHGTRKRLTEEEFMLPAILKDALQGDDPAWEGQGPVWALVTIASLIVLGDAAIFSHPRSLRLIFDALRYSSRHKISTVTILHAVVWKCAVWAFSRIFLSNDVDIRSQRDTYERAFRILVQELKPGVGSCLVGSLMYGSSNSSDNEFIASNIHQAIGILKQLIAHRNPKLFQEGLALLHRFFSCIGSRDYVVSCPVPLDYIPAGLVDGSWVRLTIPELDAAVKGVTPFPLSHIRSLTETEITAHWQDLSELWALAVERVQTRVTPELLDQLTGIWQALLLCQAHLTQGQNHLTASAPFATKLATLITRFLTPIAEPKVRETQLFLVRKWWCVLKNVFHPTWLSIPAEIVLAGILNQNIDFSVESVKQIWGEVGSDLISAGTPTLLHVLHTRVTTPSPRDEELSVTRQLWLILCRHSINSGTEKSWTSLAALLALPFHRSGWIIDLDDVESELLGPVLDATLSAARIDGVKDDEVVKHIVDQVKEEAQDLIYVKLLEAAVGLEKLSFCRTFLPIIDQILSRWYSNSEKTGALKVMRTLGRLWDLEEPSEIVSALRTVAAGTASWLEDREGLTEDNEHTEMVKAVYSTALVSLGRVIPKPIDLLSTLEKFFASVFFKVTPSAIGPLALLDFWRKYYHKNPTLDSTCPIGLLANLKAIGDIRGDSIADNISPATLSASTVIADSQSPLNAKPPGSKPDYLRFADIGGNESQVDPEAGRSVDLSLPQYETPKASARRLPFSALGALREYDSVREGPTAMSQLFLERSPESITRPRPPKRHLTEGDLPQRSVDAEDSSDVQRPLKRTKTISGPVFSPVVTPSRSRSSFAASRTQRTRAQVDSGRELAKSLLPHSPEEEDDYDIWEAGLSHKDLQDIQQETTRANDDDEKSWLEEDADANNAMDFDNEDERDGTEYDEDVLASPTFPLHSRRRDRSQTAPEAASPSLSATAHPIPRAEPLLRRHHTTCAQLDALQQAYAVVVESDGVSQMPVEELLQLKRLTSRIGQTVDEQIYQQLVRDGSGGGSGS